MFRNYTSIIIQNKRLHGQEMVDYCRESGNDALRPIGDFLEEWLNPSSELLLKTSGSTGTPKTIIAQKDQLLASAAATAEYFKFTPGQTALLCLPVQYIAGKMMIVRALYSGLNIFCVPPSSNPLSLLPAGTHIDFAAMIPMQLQQIIETQNTINIRNLLLGGGPVDSSLEKNVQQLSTHVYHGYGMTETFSHVALREINGPSASSSFHTLRGTTITTDERDCLIVHAPHIVAEPLVTNDVVEKLSSTEFIWKGRIDHVINSGGIKIFPEELESKLYPHLHRRFYFKGISDPVLGQKLILVIEGIPMAESELSFLKEKMEGMFSKYQKPREIHFVHRFNETGSGKIIRDYGK